MPVPQTPLLTIAGVVYFVLLCGVGTAVGLGILAALRFPQEGVKSVLLAPCVATMAWALSGNLLVRLGLPMRHATPLIWVASPGLAVFGLWWWLRCSGPAGSRRRASGLLVGMAAIVIIVS